MATPLHHSPPTMLRHRHAWPAPWRTSARELHQPLHPEAMTGIGLEELGHPRIVTSLAGQPPADVLGDVIVAERHRVGVAVCALSYLR